MNGRAEVNMVWCIAMALFIAGPWCARAEEQVSVETGTTSAEQVSMSIRTDQGVVHQANMSLPLSASEPVLLAPTAGGESHTVPGRSVLALLAAFDAATESFAISDLVYYDAYGSFFLNCIDTPEHLCGNWQYTVNGTYPPVGMDAYVLKDGDSVYLFFGSPRMVSLPDGALFAGEPFVATALQYDPEAGEYVPVSHYTLGVVQSNPDDPWSPTELGTVPVDTDGKAQFTIATSGEYAIGIKEDYYYPTVPFTVAERATTTTPNTGGGGGSIITSGSSFDVAGALSFLASHQDENGSFGPALYTDWAALAFGASTREAAARERVSAYLREDKPDLRSATDYERRAMALMAAGVNPYTGASTDMIAGILGYFDGVQVGDVSLVNDDIFALVPLVHAGYGEKDGVVQATTAFVCAQQQENGSWEGSIDLTAAAMQALVPLRNIACVHDAVTKAESFMRSKQESDGGFGNTFATAWALQAVYALGDTPDAWKQNGLSPLSALTSAQADDGGMESPETALTTRLWATAYAIPAALGTPWHKLLGTFARPRGATFIETSGTVYRPSFPVTTVATNTSASGTIPSVASSSMNAETPSRSGVLPTDSLPVASESVAATPVATTTAALVEENSSNVATAVTAETGLLPLVMRVLAGLFLALLIGFVFARRVYRE